MNEKLNLPPNHFFYPKLFECLKTYSKSQFISDLSAGVTVGLVALPLAMAFAIASGVKPEAGIVTAVIAGFLISALGGSKVQIGGPTGAFIIIVFGILTKYGAVNLMICTIMAGVMLLALGAFRLGSVIRFIPYPLTMGFTSGIAVMIFSTQVKDFFGLAIEEVPAGFIEKLQVFLPQLSTMQWPTFFLALGSLLVIAFWPPFLAKRLPAPIVAVVLGTILVMGFQIPVETIGSRFGGIPQGLPSFILPEISWTTIGHLFPPAFTIALLAAIESLLSAVVADGMIDDRHDSNQELMAQGIANIVCPLFGGIAATGAIARTATNVKSGGKTPIAGMIHALTLLVILLVAAPLAKFIPLASLSAVLVVVAFHMGSWSHFRRLTQWPKSDTIIFLVTFALTVLVDLTVAVQVGMLVAAILFIKKMAETSEVVRMDKEAAVGENLHSLQGQEIPEGVLVFRLFGALFFGATDKLESALQSAHQEPKILILRMRKVVAMDASGLHALEELHLRLQRKGGFIILSSPHTQPYLMMQKAGFLHAIGDSNVCPNITEALRRAREILREEKTLED